MLIPSLKSPAYLLCACWFTSIISVPYNIYLRGFVNISYLFINHNKRKVNLREVNELASGHTLSEGRRWDVSS